MMAESVSIVGRNINYCNKNGLFIRHRPDTDINLHTFSAGCPEIDRMLMFRDWLRANPTDRQLYARTKFDLARREWTFVQNYADAKSAVIDRIMARVRHDG